MKRTEEPSQILSPTESAQLDAVLSSIKKVSFIALIGYKLALRNHRTQTLLDLLQWTPTVELLLRGSDRFHLSYQQVVQGGAIKCCLLLRAGGQER